jgi:iron complex transport system ATP-binding protein
MKAGERIAVLGKSGAGKSTLLKLIAREYRAHKGNIFINGAPIQQLLLSELSQMRAVLPQNIPIAFGLLSDLVIALGRVSAQNKAQGFLEHAARMAKAHHLLGRYFNQLSGGEQARVHLARVFAQLWDVQDGLILVDEPVASLDPGLQYQLLDTIEEFASTRNHAVFAVLHDINHALNFDRLLLVESGMITKDIPANQAALPYLEELYEIRLECLSNYRGQQVMVQIRD